MKSKPAVLFIGIGLIGLSLLFILRPGTERRPPHQTPVALPEPDSRSPETGEAPHLSAAESNFLSQPETKAGPLLPRVSIAAAQSASFKLDLTNCPASIRPILDVSHDYVERQTSLRSLLRMSVGGSPSSLLAPHAQPLSRPEIESIYGFLLEKHPEDQGQRGHALKSDLMDLLCAQPEPPRDLRQVLTELVQDRDQHVVLRDYAVQHLGWLHERLPAAGSEADLHLQRRQIEAVLWDALAETDSSIGGTALLALNRAIAVDDAAAQSRLAADALRLAADAAVSPLVRLSAIQVCAQRRLEAALPFLRRTAELDPSFAVRLSAIGALGVMGDTDSRVVLQRLAGEQNPRLNPAVTLALSRIERSGR